MGRGLRVLYRMFRTSAISKWSNFVKAETSCYISRLIKKPFTRGLPWSVSIEPVNYCNLRCPECPVGAGEMSRPAGRMDWTLYRKIIDQHARTLIYLLLYFQGEPFLHPEIFRMIRYAHDKGIYVVTSTNGHFLSVENNVSLVRSGLGKLILSLDGLDQESYNIYRKGGEWNKVIEGVRNLVQVRSERGSSFPELEMQVLLMKHTYNREKEFRALARDLGVDRLRFKRMQVLHKAGTDLLPGEERASRYRQTGEEWQIKSVFPDHCSRLWRTAVYLCDGRMVPCCFDKQGIYIMGEINSNNLKGLWKGKHFREFRKRVFTERATMDICRNCTSGIKKEAAHLRAASFRS